MGCGAHLLAKLMVSPACSTLVSRRRNPLRCALLITVACSPPACPPACLPRSLLPATCRIPEKGFADYDYFMDTHRLRIAGGGGGGVQWGAPSSHVGQWAHGVWLGWSVGVSVGGQRPLLHCASWLPSLPPAPAAHASRCLPCPHPPPPLPACLQ